MKAIRTPRVVFGLAAAVSAAAAASADFSPIHDSGEPNHFEILQGIYSPSTPWFTFGARTDGDGDLVDLTNGTLRAIRVDDGGLGGPMNLASGTPGDASDQTWTGDLFEADARARYAGYSQQFGLSFVEAPAFVSLFSVGGSGLAVSGTAAVSFFDETSWNWMRDGDGDAYNSNPAENPDGEDHLVTYRIEGLGDGLNHWMLFWEDLPNLGDVDYNDLVVEVTAANVPEPGSLGLLALGTLAAIRRYAHR